MKPFPVQDKTQKGTMPITSRNIALSWALLVIMAGCLFLINRYCLPKFDELAYAFAGMSTPMEGECPRIASFSDVVQVQIGDYLSKGNGRVFVHGLVSIFAGFRLYALFDFLNTGMWFLFVWGILKASKVHIQNVKTFLFFASVIWLLLWRQGFCCANAAFAINYLWAGTATVWVIVLWNNLTHWWMIPLLFFFGWSQESFALPLLAGFAGGALFRGGFERRWPWTTKQTIAWIVAMCGLAFLCLGPSARGAAGGLLSQGLREIIESIVKAHLDLCLAGWPLIFVALLLWVIGYNRRNIMALFDRAPELWCFLFAAYGLFLLTCARAGARTQFVVYVAITVIVLLERASFGRGNRWPRRILILCAMTGVLISMAMQIVVGRDAIQMRTCYIDNPQGITMLPARNLGPWSNSVTTGKIINADDQMYLRRELGMTTNPTVLPPRLYAELYCAPRQFFKHAQEIERGSGLYVLKGLPRAVVMRGHGTLSTFQKEVLADYFRGLAYPLGIKGWLKVRWDNAHFHEDDTLWTSDFPFYFTAKDGADYTLFAIRDLAHGIVEEKLTTLP